MSGARTAVRELRRSGMAATGLAIIAVLAVVAVFAPLIAPYDPSVPSGPSLAPPSLAHPLGTTEIGADVLSALIFGTRTALLVAVPAGALAVAVGSVAGVAIGMLGDRGAQVGARAIDAFLAIPMLPLVLLLAAFAGSSPPALIVIIALAGMAPTARVVRAQTLTLRQRGFLAAARGLGAGRGYLMRRHLLPALGPVILATLVNWVGLAFLLHASLAFLGIGDPTSSAWGTIINRALLQSGIYTGGGGWLWLVLPAGLAIAVAVLGFTLLGVGLEAVMNPRWRRAG